jgi:predicted DCC family thiol-disulfide oxidoreductase YuxK
MSQVAQAATSVEAEVVEQQPRHDLVLWDRDCGFCRRSVEWVQRRDAAREARFAFAPYQQSDDPRVDDRLRQACSRAVHVLTREGAVLRAGRASLYVLRRIGYRKTSAVLGVPPLRWLVELGYWIVARNRRLFSKIFFRPRAR